ncbi:MAG: metallophosphoesterase [Acidobacteria bacterium]|nr:metallophosphoesterase [Acidobacteriota bacterium]MDA1234639.1 metallophosphoesterase [Acidobacteriota bacterium]
MEETIPLALKAATRAAELFLVVAQVHFAALLYRFLKRRGVRGAVVLSVAAGACGLFLVCVSELVTLHLELYELSRRIPPIFHLASAVHVAGSFGAYAAYLAWRLAARISGPGDATRSGGGYSRRDFLDGSAKTAMVLPFVAGGYGTFIGRDDFEVRETEIRVKGLSADLDGLRIVQISDIHYGPYLDRKDLRRVVGMANELRPQIAFLTGDFITREGDPLEECLDEVAKLKADSGLWACLGNHEEFARCSDLAESYAAEKGIQVLRQRAQGLRFGDSKINLIGVDYQRQSRGYLTGVADLVDASAFNLLLSHNPDVFPAAAAAGCDLTLSGHTHGGQITVEIVEQTLNPGRFFTPFVVGEYRIGEKAAYVTRGVGTVNMPMRIGAMPEIATLVLRSA